MTRSLAGTASRRLLAAAALAFAVLWAPARAAEQLPEQLEGVTVNEHLGAQLDTELVFRDHTGKDVRLGELVGGDVPVLLTLNYYTCATLCSLQLNAVLDGLKELEWAPGERYRVVTISIDPKEGPELAKAKRETYLSELGKGDDVDWQFLVGDEAAIRSVSEAVGFGYRYDPETGQYAHPAVITFLAPGGTVARYIYGLQYSGRDLRFALMESAAGRLGSPVDKLILSCFRYDETAGKYTPFAFGIMRLGGAATMLAMGGLGIVLWRREKTRQEGRDS